MLRALISAAKAYLAVKAVEFAANAFAGRKSRLRQAPAKTGRMAKPAGRPAARTKAAA
jgi:hypothetical protein